MTKYVVRRVIVITNSAINKSAVNTALIINVHEEWHEQYTFNETFMWILRAAYELVVVKLNLFLRNSLY